MDKKIALLTFYTEPHQKIADLTIDNKNDYCTNNNYFHLVKKGPYSRPNLYYAIDRLIYLYDILFNVIDDDQYLIPDIFWVLNVQSIITNYNKKIEDLLDDEHDFYVSRDVGGENMGSFIVKRSEWSKKYLKFLCEESPKNPTQHWGNHWEQAIVQKNMDNPEFKDKIKILSQSYLNSYVYGYYPPWNTNTPGDWRPGDLCLSFPGMDVNKRLVEIPKHFDKIIKS